MCVECSKVCRSRVEEEQHTRFTGHSTFKEDASGGQVLDTEAEIMKIRQSEAEEKAEEELVPPEVDEGMVQQLVDMGFGRNKAVRALHYSGGGVEQALEWMVSHEDDVALCNDEPLLVPPKKETGPKLTPEEAKAKAEELIRKAKERREAEEREMEKLREAERIRSGKELAAIARKEEEQRLRRMAEERLREKEEEARAREKIKKKLEQDRMERRAALGLPPELTEEEKEEQRRRLEEKAQAAAASKLPVKPREKADKMRNLLVAMKKNNSGSPDAVSKGFQTLHKLIGNIAAQPDNPKFRTIKLDNPAIQDRVGRFPEAIEFLCVAGFHQEGSILTLPEQDTCLATLDVALENLDSAINNPFFGAL